MPDHTAVMTFREYSPAELAAAVLDAGGSLDVVTFEARDQEGNVVATNLMALSIEVDRDFDRTGGYSWVKIIARPEAGLENDPKG